MNDWKVNVDIAAAGTIMAAIVGWFPAIAGALGIIWYAIQILESATIQDILRRRRAANLARRKARLQAKHEAVERELAALKKPPAEL